MSVLFNGRWKIDLDQSVVWDDAAKKHVRDEVGQEFITLGIKGNIQDYEVLLGDRPQIRMGYTAQYDDSQWVSYAVREVISDAANVEQEISDFKRRIKAPGTLDRSYVVGTSYTLIRLISVDDYTHYRVSKSPKTGAAQTIMLRRMARDEQSYLATVLDVDGVVFRIRRFVRA